MTITAIVMMTLKMIRVMNTSTAIVVLIFATTNIASLVLLITFMMWFEEGLKCGLLVT